MESVKENMDRLWKEQDMDKTLKDIICKKLSEKVPETGGILGSREGKLQAFFYDEKGSCSKKCYIPDVECLNRQIKKWNEDGLEFAGIVHSHWDKKELSAQDIRYARQVVRVFGRDIIMGVFVYNVGQLYLYKVSEEKVMDI